MQDLLRRQWSSLGDWLATTDALSRGDLPIGLGTWSVRDVIAHLGYGIGMVAELKDAPDGTVPWTLERYVAAYPPAAPVIAKQTHELATRLGRDLLSGIDSMAQAAWAHLDSIQTDVVLGRRGPLTRDDYLTTRLIEVVVHGDDLARTLLHHKARSPLLPQALELVSEVLAAVYEARAGTAPDKPDAVLWIRRSCGRIPTYDEHLPLL